MTSTSSAATRTALSTWLLRWSTYFTTCSVPSAVAWTVLLSFVVRVVTLPIVLLADSFGEDWSPPPMGGAGVFKMVVGGLILAPLVETFLNQWLVFRVAARVGLLPARALWVILLSALTFGALHSYSFGYMVLTSGVGLVWALAFWLRGAGRQAFWIVAATHAVLNSVALLVTLAER